MCFRVERVEAGLPADKAGMRPGDYIIFVDNYNVVTMPEEEILNFIRLVFIFSSAASLRAKAAT